MTSEVDDIIRKLTIQVITDSLLKGVVTPRLGKFEHEAAQALTTYIDSLVERVIGEDELHDNGSKMVNDPASCMGCTNPDKRFARNGLRAEQRNRYKQIKGE